MPQLFDAAGFEVKCLNHSAIAALENVPFMIAPFTASDLMLIRSDLMLRRPPDADLMLTRSDLMLGNLMLGNLMLGNLMLGRA